MIIENIYFRLDLEYKEHPNDRVWKEWCVNETRSITGYHDFFMNNITLRELVNGIVAKETDIRGSTRVVRQKGTYLVSLGVVIPPVDLILVSDMPPTERYFFDFEVPLYGHPKIKYDPWNHYISEYVAVAEKLCHEFEQRNVKMDHWLGQKVLKRS